MRLLFLMTFALLSMPALAQVRVDGRILDDPGMAKEDEMPKIILPEPWETAIAEARAIVDGLRAYTLERARRENREFPVLVTDPAALLAQGKPAYVDEIKPPTVYENPVVAARRARREIEEGPPPLQLDPVGAASVQGVLLWDNRCGARSELDQLGPELRRLSLIGFGVMRCEDQAARSALRQDLRKYGLIPLVLDEEEDPANATLSRIPPEENARNIMSLVEARNVGVLVRLPQPMTKEEFILALEGTNHDVLLVDPLLIPGEPLVTADVQRLQIKATGARRLVMAAFPLGHAKPAAYYWQPGWVIGRPVWLQAPAADGTVAVRYGNDEWKALLGRLVQDTMTAGYDGLVLTKIRDTLEVETLRLDKIKPKVDVDALAGGLR